MKDRQRDLFLQWVVVQAFGVGAALAVYSHALRYQVGTHGVFGGAGYLQSGYWTGSSFGSAVQFVYSGVREVMALTFPGYTFTLMVYAGSMVLALHHWRTLCPYLIAAPIAVPVAASLLGLYPLFNGRQDLFLTPLIILVAAATFDYLSRIDSRRHLYALFLAWLAWRAIPSLASYYQTDGEGAVGKLVERVAFEALPGDPIYVCLGGDPIVSPPRAPLEGRNTEYGRCSSGRRGVSLCCTR